jgi:hypothetical protein
VTNGPFVESTPYVLLLIPIALLDLGLVVFALLDLNQRPVTRGPKWLWIAIIVLITVAGPISYLIFGRQKDSGKRHRPQP